VLCSLSDVRNASRWQGGDLRCTRWDYGPVSRCCLSPTDLPQRVQVPVKRYGQKEVCENPQGNKEYPILGGVPAQSNAENSLFSIEDCTQTKPTTERSQGKDGCLRNRVEQKQRESGGFLRSPHRRPGWQECTQRFETKQVGVQCRLLWKLKRKSWLGSSRYFLVEPRIAGCPEKRVETEQSRKVSRLPILASVGTEIAPLPRMRLDAFTLRSTLVFRHRGSKGEQ
jgi:hypothetical protein